MQLKWLMGTSSKGTKPSAAGSGIKKRQNFVNKNDEVHSTFTLCFIISKQASVMAPGENH